MTRVCGIVERKFRNYEKSKEKRQKGEDTDSDPYEVDQPDVDLIHKVLAPEVNEIMGRHWECCSLLDKCIFHMIWESMSLRVRSYCRICSHLSDHFWDK